MGKFTVVPQWIVLSAFVCDRFCIDVMLYIIPSDMFTSEDSTPISKANSVWNINFHNATRLQNSHHLHQGSQM